MCRNNKSNWVPIFIIPSKITLYCKMSIIILCEWISSFSNKVNISKNSIVSCLFIISLFNCIMNIRWALLLGNLGNILGNILEWEDIFWSYFSPLTCSMVEFIKHILFEFILCKYHKFIWFRSENLVYCLGRSCQYLTQSPCLMSMGLFWFFSEFSWNIKDNWHAIKMTK